MRPIELLLVVFVASAAALGVVYFQKPCPRWLAWSLWIAGAVLAAIQIFWEGWRLELLPASVALIGLIPLFSVQGRGIRAFLTAGVLAGALASAAGIYMLPVFTLPTPGGPYRVGTFVRHLIDPSRHERHASSPNAPRELMIQVWYPAKNVQGVRAWYRDPRMDTWQSSHLRLVKTHSYWNLPVATEPGAFPVLLFSPSSGGFRSQNTFEVEELVSQGYIVVGMDHPYSGSRVVFPDGRVVRSVPWIDTSDQAAFEASAHRVELMVEDHVADARFVLGELERWNRPGSGEVLAGRMELTKVGVFGHSFGGALAGELCDRDPRVVAGINMDGWMFGDALKSGVRKPFLYMNSGDGRAPDRVEIEKRPLSWRIEGEQDLSQWQAMETSLNRFGGYHLTVLGSDHGNYSDLVLFKRIPSFHGTHLDPYRAFEIINAYTLAFFDRYLRNRPSPLLGRDVVSSEVRFEVYPAPFSASGAMPKRTP
jgi:pimeloyl-ACP methyl ester carboxylesterase